MKSLLHSMFITIIMVASGLLSFCTENTPTSSTAELIHRSSVMGKVTNKKGVGLGNVSVTASPGGYTTNTLPNGEFTLPDLVAGSYQLHFQLTDFLDTVTSNIEVGLGDTLQLAAPIGMKFRFGYIVGTVQDAHGTPLPMAGVGVEQQSAGGTAVSGGVFSLSRVEPGAVRLFGAMPGKGFGSYTLQVLADDTSKNALIVLDHMGGTIQGSLLDSADKAQANAIVSTVGGILADTTNAEGLFEIAGVPSNAAVRLTLKNGTKTGYVDGLNVDEGGSLDIGAITSAPVLVQNGIALFPTIALGRADEKTMTLVISSTTDAGIRIAGYEWDLNADLTSDTSTIDGRLSIPVGVAGTDTILVRALSTDTAAARKYSKWMPILLRVSPAPSGAKLINTSTALLRSRVVAGSPYRDTIAATDPRGDSLRFFFADSLPGMTITRKVGSLAKTTKNFAAQLTSYAIIIWTPTAADTGTRRVSIVATNGKTLSDTLRWNIVVTAIGAPDDTVKPRIDSASVQSLTPLVIRVHFSKPMDSLSIADTANYAIRDTAGVPQLAGITRISQLDSRSVDCSSALVISTATPDQLVLRIRNVRDVAGNVIAANAGVVFPTKAVVIP